MITQLTGITNDMVRNAPVMHEDVTLSPNQTGTQAWHLVLAWAS